jgi:hypothetical protein
VIPSGLLIGLLLAARVPLVALGGALPMLPAVGLGVMLALVAAGLIDGVLSRARDER